MTNALNLDSKCLGSDKQSRNWKKVIVADEMWQALLARAAKEELLVVKDDKEKYAGIVSEEAEQNALALLVLFDEILLPHSDYISSPSVPFLQEKGILLPIKDTLDEKAGISSDGWARNKDFPWKAAALARTQQIRPLILERLATIEDPYWPKLKDIVRIRKEQFYDALLNYAQYIYSADLESAKTSVLNMILSPTQVALITEDLLYRNREFTNWTVIDWVLFGALSHLSNIEFAQAVSRKYNSPVATTAFSYSELKSKPNFPLNSAEMMCIMRTAMFDDDGCFPLIESIKHALRLRRDPNLRSFKKQIQIFQEALDNGEVIDLPVIKKELDRAREIVQQNFQCKGILDFVSYAAVPISVYESLTGIVPVTGLILGTLSAAATYTANSDMKNSGWSILGR